MNKALLFFLRVSLFTIGYFFASNSIVKAQVTTDGTVNTQVNQDGNVAEITGGQTRGGNLFHSFQNFSVGTGNEAFFNNADSISNIFSRVTGGSVSNIDGAIRANGSASLFLINPAGIIFGENARLDIGGSFYGSTATSVLFEEGEFSAVDNLEQPVLTINAPIGLGFRDEPGVIVNNSLANDGRGLEVNPGNNLSLLGGNVTFNGGAITALGGIVELGGLSTTGEIRIEESGSLSFPDAVERADISLTNGALVNVRNTGGGFITINGRNVSLSDESILLGGIESGLGSTDAQAGDVVINGDSILLEDNSQIRTSTEVEGTGDSGNIFVTATNIEFADEIQGDDIASKLVTSTFGQGDAGDIEINGNNIVFDGSGGGLFTNVGVRANENSVPGIVGDGGDITINTDSISLLNGARLTTILGGIGTGGNITVNANSSVRIDGEGDSVPLFVEFFGGEQRRASGIASQVRGANLLGGEDAVGNAGVVEINTQDFFLTNSAGFFANITGQGDASDITIDATGNIELDNNARIFAQVFANVGEGDAGNITINANSLAISNESQIQTDTQSLGNAGSISINANEISLTERVFINSGTGISGDDVEGDAGNISINTDQLFLANSFIEAFTSGNGNAGDVTVQASEEIILDDGAAITADVRDGGLGTGGNIFLATPSLSVKNGSRLSTSSFEQGVGDAGSINIDASERIDITTGGEVRATTENDSSGGNINLNSRTLNLSNNGRIFALSEGNGNAGNINLQISEDIILDGMSNISTTASGDGNGGNLDMSARFIIAFPSSGNGNDITTNAEGGNGGNITINAESLFGLRVGKAVEGNQTNDIDASSVFSLDGNVTINTPDINPAQGATELPSNVAVSEETAQKICETNQEIAAKNRLIVKGKGGLMSAPGLPLNSFNVLVDGEIDSDSKSTIPAPIETSQGKIQPARGIKITESGDVILAAYRTNNEGQRIPEKRNCG